MLVLFNQKLVAQAYIFFRIFARGALTDDCSIIGTERSRRKKL